MAVAEWTWIEDKRRFGYRVVRLGAAGAVAGAVAGGALVWLIKTNADSAARYLFIVATIFVAVFAVESIIAKRRGLSRSTKVRDFLGSFLLGAITFTALFPVAELINKILYALPGKYANWAAS